MTNEHVVRVPRFGWQYKPFSDLFQREGVEDKGVGKWMQSQGVKYEISIAYDYFTFPDYDAWVQFQLTWLS